MAYRAGIYFQQTTLDGRTREEARGGSQHQKGLLRPAHGRQDDCHQSGKIPEDINTLLDDNISSEAVFKWKLQIFEREDVQNSENKKARAKIRKATTLVETSNLNEFVQFENQMALQINDRIVEEKKLYHLHNMA